MTFSRNYIHYIGSAKQRRTLTPGIKHRVFASRFSVNLDTSVSLDCRRQRPDIEVLCTNFNLTATAAAR